MKKWLLAFLALASVINSPVVMANDKKDAPEEQGVNIYIARHGKTFLNTFDRVQGWADSPLTDQGRLVARYLGEGLKDIHFDRFYSSDAGRQRETMAVVLTQKGITDYHLNELPGLREAFFGSFEGAHNKEMANAAAHKLGMADGGELFNAMMAGKIALRDSQNALASADPSGLAENYAQVKARTQAALSTIVERAKAEGDKNVLVISSGMSMQIMISDLTPDPARNKPIANAAVVKIVYKNGKYTVPEIGTLKYVDAGKKSLTGE